MHNRHGELLLSLHVMLDVAKDKYNTMIEDANAKINERKNVYSHEDIPR